MCFSTARSLSDSASAIALLFFPWAIWASVSCSRGVSIATGERAATPRREEDVDHLGVDHRAAACDFSNGARELLAVRDAFLEEVSATLGAGGEERKRVRGLEIVAQHHDTRIGVTLTQLLCRSHTFVGARRRHANVGQDDVGLMGRHEREQSCRIPRTRRQA